VTDDETKPAAAEESPAETRPNRRRWFIGLGIGLAALLIIGTCAGVGAVFVAAGRFFDELGDTEAGARRADSACSELERRLNRVSPPGAAADPRGRAVAIRNENTAVRPFLNEMEDLSIEWQVGTDGDRRDWIGWWRQLVDARTAYADALDRQAAGGEPAFFVAPQARRGETVVDRMDWIAPDPCRGAIRRLAEPDL
jgi:hypothetical protein